MADDIGEILFRQARAWGATDLRIEQGGKHPRLIGRYKGLAFTFVFPGSSSDRRATLNCLSTLRRVLGIEREAKRAHRPAKPRSRRTNPKVHRLERIAKPIQREDRYYAPLAQLRDSMESSRGRATETDDDRPLRLRTPFLGRRSRFLKV